METKQTKLSIISNDLLLFFVFFLITLIWINFHIRNIVTTLISSIIILTFFIIIYYIIKLKKRTKSRANTIENEQFSKLKNQFLYGKLEYNTRFLLNIFKIADATKLETNHYITNDSDYYFIFTNNSISVNTEQIFQNAQTNNITIFCLNNFDILKLKNYNITQISLEDINKKLLKNNHYPIYYAIIEKPPTFSLKNLLCAIFNKKKSKEYFTIGFLILFSSLFTIYNIYYITVGTILLLLSIFSRFNKKYQNTT